MEEKKDNVVCLCCGKLMPYGSSFCNSCGSDLSAAPAPGLAGAVSPEEFEACLRAGRTYAGGALPAVCPGVPAPPSPPHAQPRVPYAYPYSPAACVRKTTDNLAIASLVCAVAAFVLFPLLPAIAAIVTGLVSRERIRESAGRLGGSGMALAGILAGIANVVLCAALLAIAVTVYYSQ